MDEPMENTSDACSVSEQSLKGCLQTVSRHSNPNNMGIMGTGRLGVASLTITEAEYESEYWPKLDGAITQLLTLKPGDYVPISYEEVYTCVYKCVCKQFSERLHSDLLQKIISHLEHVSGSLQSYHSHAYVEKFSFALSQYLQALSGIVPIFNYMNRCYIEPKLKLDLNKQLRTLFVTCVAEKHITNLIPLLVHANTRPFAVFPSTMSTLIKNLYSLKPEYAELRPRLFAMYIPSVLPPCSESQLDNYISEARQMQRDLLTDPDFISGDQSRKRASDDDWHSGVAAVGVASGEATA